MEWTKRHDTMLFREVLVVNTFQAKKKTVQRAMLWQNIATTLKTLGDPPFKQTLTKRSVQDRCSLLCEKYRKRMSYEKTATGISPEVTELNILIEETIHKEEAHEELRKRQSKKLFVVPNAVQIDNPFFKSLINYHEIMEQTITHSGD